MRASPWSRPSGGPAIGDENAWSLPVRPIKINFDNVGNLLSIPRLKLPRKKAVAAERRGYKSAHSHKLLIMRI
jgi:hypothetical protein